MNNLFANGAEYFGRDQFQMWQKLSGNELPTSSFFELQRGFSDLALNELGFGAEVILPMLFTGCVLAYL
jgi:hypothetical protein